jgi:predicted nucleic acid-binding protein
MLTGEQRKENESAQVAGFALEIERREVIAVTSALTQTEILGCTLTAQQQEIMTRLIRPPKVQVKDVSQPIMTLTREIRDYYQAERKAGRSNLPTVETPDAIHLATAIYFECPRFFTFDENDHPGGKNPKRALIPLSGKIAGRYPLEVCKPFCASAGLELQ